MCSPLLGTAVPNFGPGIEVEAPRLQAYLQAACSVLNFDIGEIWCCQQDDDGEGGGGNISALHFFQLYTSPSYCVYRSKLVTPSDDWDRDRKDASQKHRFSPQICEAVQDGGQIVWASTRAEGGLLGRSDLPLRTAVGAPVCCPGYNLCVLVMFSPRVLISSPEAMEFIYTMAQAASQVMCGFSRPISMPPFQTGAPNDAYSDHTDHRRSRAIIDSLKRKSIIFQTWDLTKIPQVANLLRQGVGASGLGPSPPPLSRTSSMDLLQELLRPRTPTSVAQGLNCISASSSSASLAGSVSNTESSGMRVGAPVPRPPPLLFRSSSAEWSFNDIHDIGALNDDEDFNIWCAVMDGLSQSPGPHSFGFTPPPSSSMLSPTSSMIVGSPKPLTPTVSTDALSSMGTGSDCVSSSVELLEDPLRRSRLDEFIHALLHISPFNVADYWVPGSEGLLHLGSSIVKDQDFAKWRSFCSTVTFKLGFGPPGRIALNHQPMWEEQYSEESGETNPLAPVAKIIGLRTAFGVPIPIGGGKVGVVMFYSTSHLERSTLMLNFVEKALLVLLGDPLLPPPAPSSPVSFSACGAATSLGRVAGSYSSHSRWLSLQQQSHQGYGMPSTNTHTNSTGVHPGLEAAVAAARLEEVGASSMGASTPFPGAVSHTIMPPSDIGSDLNKKSRVTLRVAPPRVEGFPIGGLDLMSSHAPPPVPASAVFFPPLSEIQQLPMGSHSFYTPPLPTVPPIQVPLPTPVPNDVKMEMDESPAAVPVSTGRRKRERASTPRAAAAVVPPPPQPVSSPTYKRGVSTRLCERPGCGKCAQGSTSLCIAHGGGRRCTFPNCNKGARDKFFCAAHGGGKRCKVDGCKKAAAGGTDLCTAHGGGRRCSVANCTKSAQSATPYCVKHGGGRQCSVEGCEKVARGRTANCASHGGGIRCKLSGCNKAAIGKQQLCRVHLDALGKLPEFA